MRKPDQKKLQQAAARKPTVERSAHRKSSREYVFVLSACSSQGTALLTAAVRQAGAQANQETVRFHGHLSRKELLESAAELAADLCELAGKARPGSGPLLPLPQLLRAGDLWEFGARELDDWMVRFATRGLLYRADDAGVVSKVAEIGSAQVALVAQPLADARVRIHGELVVSGARAAPDESTGLIVDTLIGRGHTLLRLPAREHGQWLRRLGPSNRLEIPTGQLLTVFAELADAPGSPPLSAPPELLPPVTRPTPRGCLRIARLGSWHLAPTSASFLYDGREVHLDEPRQRIFDPLRKCYVERAPEGEQQLLDQLRAQWPEYRTDVVQNPLAVERLPDLVRVLHGLGWQIFANNKQLRAPGARRLTVKSSGRDWFDLSGEVEYGDRRIGLSELLAAAERNERIVQLDDGSLGLLPEDWLRRQQVLLGLGQVRKTGIRFARSQALLLDHLLADREVSGSVDRGFAAARQRLARATPIGPVDPPAALRVSLRPYQREGLGWIHHLREVGFGGCLADDMGLGKTLQVLALLVALKDGGRPSIVVAPRSLLFHWQDEARRFAPDLRVIAYHGVGRREALDGLAGGSVLLTTYGTIARDVEELHGIAFDTAVLDESQAIKNRGTQTAKAVRLIQAEHRIAVSGTPVENHLGELYSLFEFLNPGLLGTFAAFQRVTEGDAGAERRAGLAAALRPLLLRRTKTQVAPELPERIENTLHCEMREAQRTLYDGVRAHIRDHVLGEIAVGGLDQNRMQVIEALLRLRQIACHPALLDPAHVDLPTAKFEVLLPMLAEIAEQGHKALVFSQFTSYLALLKRQLDALGLPYEYLDGKTADRRVPVDRFQNDPACPVFLISLKAGGVGLNLTAASYVFLLDPWWNPAVEAQAIDRSHRIGQTRTVTAYRLITRDTVEEKIAALQADKRSIADSILNQDNSVLRSLDLEELRKLLS